MSKQLSSEQQKPPSGMVYRNALLKRLIEQYLTGRDLDEHEFNVESIAHFHRLYRYIVAEGYGA